MNRYHFDRVIIHKDIGAYIVGLVSLTLVHCALIHQSETITMERTIPQCSTIENKLGSVKKINGAK